MVSKEKTNFIIIIGLPGSGKTTLANRMALEIPNAIVLDDFSLHYHKDYKDKIKGYRSVIITDPSLCDIANEQVHIELTLELMFDKESDECTFSFIYFANDPEACIINARRDPKPGGTENYIKMLTQKYVIPDGAFVKPVYKEPSDEV